MDGVVSYNTESMGEWYNNTKSMGENFEDMVSELYSLIDGFVADEFTGTLSDEFKTVVDGQREYYSNLKDTIDESANLIKQHAEHYEDNEAMLASQIQSNNLNG